MYNCRYCDKQFNSLKGLNAHAGLKHKNEVLLEYVKIDKDVLDITKKDLLNKRSLHTCTCDVCGKVETANTRPKDKDYPNNLCIDHDHNLKKFRGFLCVQCNRNFGWYDKYKDKIQEHALFKHV